MQPRIDEFWEVVPQHVAEAILIHRFLGLCVSPNYINLYRFASALGQRASWAIAGGTVEDPRSGKLRLVASAELTKALRSSTQRTRPNHINLWGLGHGWHQHIYTYMVRSRGWHPHIYTYD